MTRIPKAQRAVAGTAEPGSSWQGRLDSLLYLALAALLTASTLNGLAFHWTVLGTEVTIRPDQAVLVFLLPLLARAWVLGRFRVELTLFDWVVFGFLFSNFVASLLFSPSRGASLKGTVLLGLYASTYFVVRQILASRPKWLPMASSWVLGLGIAQAVYSVFALALYSRGYVIGGVQRGHLTETSVALKGTFWEANLLGAYVALIAVFFAVRYLWKPEGQSGRTLLFGLFITSLVLPLTLTRAAGLALALAVVAIALIGWRFRREIGGWGRRTAAITLILGGVLLLTVTAMDDFVSGLSRHPNFLIERWIQGPWMPASGQSAAIQGATRPYESDLLHASRSSVDGRVEVWLLAVEAWRESPILGHGTLAGGAVVKEGWWYSSLVQALYDTGLLGFCLLLWIYAGAILYPLMAWLRHRQSPMSANLLGFSVGNAVLFFTSQFSSFLFVGFPWVFLGLSMAAVDADSKARSAQRAVSKYYFFGLRAGLANLATNGLRLGLRKTAGKITQPINVFSRFPEYYCFDVAIQRHLGRLPASGRHTVLDVGSPKLFGLYLANRFDLHAVLTDITPLNIDEYHVMWRALAGRAKGRATFVQQDGRHLGFPDDCFDVVYAMSVLEHIERETGDSEAMAELIRVLKPGGLLVVSVPFGPIFLEQRRVGFSGAARRTHDRQTYFFQRVYDRHQLNRRLVEPVQDLEGVTLTTLSRRHAWVARAFGRLGENVRGFLGFLNPVLSAALVRIVPGVDDSFPTRYGPLHSASDVYGDLIFTGRKR